MRDEEGQGVVDTYMYIHVGESTEKDRAEVWKDVVLLYPRSRAVNNLTQRNYILRIILLVSSINVLNHEIFHIIFCTQHRCITNS